MDAEREEPARQLQGARCVVTRGGGFGPRFSMPTIYLEHPVHGTKVATLDIEADFDEQNGWTRYTIDTPTEEVEVVEEQVEEPVAVEEVVNTLKPKSRRKTA